MRSDETFNYYNCVGYQCLDHLKRSFVDLYLSTCGIQSCPPGHTWGPDTRDIYIIHFICDGTGIYRTGGKTYNLKRGDFFVIYPDTEVYYSADTKKPWEYMWIGFNGINAENYLSYAGIDREHLTGEYNNPAFILTNIQQMIISRSLTYHNEMRRQSYLLQILASLVEDYQSSLPSQKQYTYPNHVYLQQAFDYISDNIGNSIKVAEVADYIGINRSYLTSLFKKAMNISPQEYIINAKMERAEHLLKNSSLKVNCIAKMVGYGDALTFSKMFKKYKGMTPIEMRNTALSQDV